MSLKTWIAGKVLAHRIRKEYDVKALPPIFGWLNLLGTIVTAIAGFLMGDKGGHLLVGGTDWTPYILTIANTFGSLTHSISLPGIPTLKFPPWFGVVSNMFGVVMTLAVPGSWGVILGALGAALGVLSQNAVTVTPDARPVTP